jgi:hypothetical protein
MTNKPISWGRKAPRGGRKVRARRGAKGLQDPRRLREAVQMESIIITSCSWMLTRAWCSSRRLTVPNEPREEEFLG